MSILFHPTAIPGRYDSMLDLVAAGGVEIRGLHTIRAPRRLTHDPPLVNEFVFQPYVDVNEDDRTWPYTPQALKDYADACLELSRQGTKRWLEQDEQELLPNKDNLIASLNLANTTVKKSAISTSLEEAKTVLDSLVKNKNGVSLPTTGLHTFLEMAFTEPYCSDFFENLRPKLHDYRFDLWDDPILTSLTTDEIVRLCLDTVADNVTTQTMTILEAGAIKSAFFRHAFPKALEEFTIKDYRYYVADKFIVEDAVKYPVKMLMFDPTEPENFPETYRETFDLLILKNVLHYQRDLDLAIIAYSEMVKPGGFILVEELVERLSLLYPVESFVTPSLNTGLGGPEGDRILGCYYSDSQWRAFFARHSFEEIIHRNNAINSSLYLLRKQQVVVTPPRIIYIDDLQFSWLDEVQARFAEIQQEPEDARLWLVATSKLSGIWGFFGCLRWEMGSEKLRCVHICNTKPESKFPEITMDSAEFKELMKKDLAYNVYRDGRWGTYRLYNIKEEARLLESPRDHVFADCYTPNDLLSLRWFDSPLKIGNQTNRQVVTGAKNIENDLCTVYYAGLNLRDILLASGTVKIDDLPEGMQCRESVLGVEFSGRDSLGRRVMGLCDPPALATSVRCSRASLWPVPEHWTLEAAATVPAAYAIAYYALIAKAKVKQGDTVLVQSGWTAIGQAAITVALSYDCEVFTLVRSSKEADMLKTICPQLKDKNMFISGDKTFQRQILVETGRKGISIILPKFN
ncbi:fatty acid synthase-like [Plakobranchus ocellatus]|uniref:Fatty acid synthase-like n=1 Tax=Plakobranchus ocellatus TaxID=259542 RepID=A0AAV4AE24_9GAST|nr:fatty acid synthase-like [Plakobranchus ocellatus]